MMNGNKVYVDAMDGNIRIKKVRDNNKYTVYLSKDEADYVADRLKAWISKSK